MKKASFTYRDAFKAGYVDAVEAYLESLQPIPETKKSIKVSTDLSKKQIHQDEIR